MADVRGLAELDRALAQFPIELQRKAMRRALKAGAQVFEREAKARVPRRTGRLHDSIHIVNRIVNGRMTATVMAGGRAAFYAHMVEFGTQRHFIRAKNRKALNIAGTFGTLVDHPGAREKAFMRPAFEHGHLRATQIFGAVLTFEIPRIAANLARMRRR